MTFHFNCICGQTWKGSADAHTLTQVRAAWRTHHDGPGHGDTSPEIAAKVRAALDAVKSKEEVKRLEP